MDEVYGNNRFYIEIDNKKEAEKEDNEVMEAEIVK